MKHSKLERYLSLRLKETAHIRVTVVNSYIFLTNIVSDVEKAVIHGDYICRKVRIGSKVYKIKLYCHLHIASEFNLKLINNVYDYCEMWDDIFRS